MFIEIPTAVSNCLQHGNGYYCEMARQQQCRHQAKQNDGTVGDEGTTGDKGEIREGGKAKEQKGPRDVKRCLLGCW